MSPLFGVNSLHIRVLFFGLAGVAIGGVIAGALPAPRMQSAGTVTSTSRPSRTSCVDDYVIELPRMSAHATPTSVSSGSVPDAVEGSQSSGSGGSSESTSPMSTPSASAPAASTSRATATTTPRPAPSEPSSTVSKTLGGGPCQAPKGGRVMGWFMHRAAACLARRSLSADHVTVVAYRIGRVSPGVVSCSSQAKDRGGVPATS